MKIDLTLERIQSHLNQWFILPIASLVPRIICGSEVWTETQNVMNSFGSGIQANVPELQP